MKKILYFTILIISYSFFGQAKVAKKPEYVIVIENEIGSMEQLEKYANEGYLKTMNKGVKEKERNQLAEKFGDIIGEKEFIITVTLFTEKEKIENLKTENSKVVAEQNVKKEVEYILNVNDKRFHSKVNRWNRSDTIGFKGQNRTSKFLGNLVRTLHNGVL